MAEVFYGIHRIAGHAAKFKLREITIRESADGYRVGLGRTYT
jgi:hypothetical protein